MNLNNANVKLALLGISSMQVMKTSGKLRPKKRLVLSPIREEEAVVDERHIKLRPDE